MPSCKLADNGKIEIDFGETIPDDETKNRMKAENIRWNRYKKVWAGPVSDRALEVADKICRGTEPPRHYGLKLTIGEVVSASEAQKKQWVEQLSDFVDNTMGENYVSDRDRVNDTMKNVWMDCFDFIARKLAGLDIREKGFELVFEYCLPDTIYERPDVILLTSGKVISLEFKKKKEPQIEGHKDDVAQAVRYRDWLRNHHKETKARSLDVTSFLVCTDDEAESGFLRRIRILTASDFSDVIREKLAGESACTFTDQWLASPGTVMPDMLMAIGSMYGENRIPYITDLSTSGFPNVFSYIHSTEKNGGKLLIVINGTPGSGKTAVGEHVVFECNRGGEPKAIFLSVNMPLVEVLSNEINKAGKRRHMAENVIRTMKAFRATYFPAARKRNVLPDQSVFVYDEAQRAWDGERLGYDSSDPEELLTVADRVCRERGFAVVIALYGDRQALYKGEKGFPLWKDALANHKDWSVVASDAVSEELRGTPGLMKADNSLCLRSSFRTDFIDCGGWVEQAIGRTGASPENAKKELSILQKTSMRIFVTRSMDAVKKRAAWMDDRHPEWKYGLLFSGYAETSVLKKIRPDWNLRSPKSYTVWNGEFGRWFGGECRKLEKACGALYGVQGLELDCPVVIFGGEYIRRDGQWISNGNKFGKVKEELPDPEASMENIFRVLLTRARKEMILLIPQDPVLDETYKYFVDMGMDIL